MDHHHSTHFCQPYPFPESFHDLDLASDEEDYHHHDRFPGLHPRSSYGRLDHLHHRPLASACDHLHHYDTYDPRLVESYYRQMEDVLPHHLPMFSDPYEFGYGALDHSPMAYGNERGMGFHSAMYDPFSYGIDHDYGYGRIPPLNTYGLHPHSFGPEFGPTLDDLYLFELMLRSDAILSEHERLRRWQERLAWEELNELERANRWRQMSLMRRRELGLGHGSYWGSRFGSLPLDHTLGYVHPFPIMGRSAIRRGHTHPLGFPGPAHYPLSGSLGMRYPMWGVGGLGIGRRISGWYLKPKHLLRQAEIRLEYAERRGEIPPRPRIVGPGLMGTGVPGMAPELSYGLGHSTRVRHPMML
ncbi:hypothetical protein CROQUDRAFT_652661 [Cronartium quercuum f. sp. fusiforme G11]|uniref:Uncharacterized protein n=1 Tax=Cronartium quercuum f. sp. fusiforme G11 TaxID=708437 RepID=A0A9P6NQM3_9BASI|nr:hypothetical protein CROQUDRAFT_652661 [Cronartium quercuum f. sp. fusiforme G11]